MPHSYQRVSRAVGKRRGVDRRDSLRLDDSKFGIDQRVLRKAAGSHHVPGADDIVAHLECWGLKLRVDLHNRAANVVARDVRELRVPDKARAAAEGAPVAGAQGHCQNSDQKLPAPALDNRAWVLRRHVKYLFRAPKGFREHRAHIHG